MELIGQIKDIIYKNEINSYTVAEFETEEEIITVTGYLPFINIGDTLKLIGKYVEHKDYGMQFKVDTFEKVIPKTPIALERYLANGNVKGIGPILAEKIVEKFQDKTIYIMKSEPERLSEIKGISRNKALEISESFIENWEIWKIVGFLEKFGIGAEKAKRVFDLFGTDAMKKIEENPYDLIKVGRGIDFKQIDQMALELGVGFDNENRIMSGIRYALIKSSFNGHACVIKQNLIEFVIDLLDVSTESIENGIINLSVAGEIVLEKRDEQEYVYLEELYKVEEQIVYLIKRLQRARNEKKVSNLKQVLKQVEKNSNIELSEKQKEALEMINNNNVTILTGGPGTGKTTIIKKIIEIFESKGKKVVLAAPTGRAAKRITETTNREASTLHRLLEINTFDEDNVYQGAKEYEGAPIDADVIIVDEASMMDMFLLNYLLKCIYQGTKLVLVGDADQLPSVRPGRVLKDLINSEEIPTIHLDKIFRQAARSKIILNAHRVNNGQTFIQKGEEDTLDDFFFIKENNQEKILKEIISLCTGRLKKYGNYDFFKNIQVLTPTKKGMLRN